MLEQYITSFVEGRVRLRHAALRDSPENTMAETIHGLLSSMPGVLSVQINTRTGSLLMYYDPDVLEQDTLWAMLQQGDQWLDLTASDNQDTTPDTAQKKSSYDPRTDRPVPARESCRRRRRIYNRVLLGSMVACLALAVSGPMRAHQIAGWLCAALNAGHLWQVRRGL